MEPRRIVVTGMGTINPLGNNAGEMWSALKEGRSGLGPITLFDTEDFVCKIAGEVKNWEPGDWMERKDARKMARFTQFSVAAADQALADAEMNMEKINTERMGIILGSGIGGYEVTEEGMRALVAKGPRGISPLTIPKLIHNEAPANIAIRHKIYGPCYSLVTACTSGTDSLGSALNSIRMGQIDIAIAGGVEAAITPFSIGGFQKLTAVSTNYNDKPTAASRPFDKDRDGFVMGEGVGLLILEELGHAQKRGAKIYAELIGYGMSCDAYHLTSPDSEGKGLVRSITWAMADAGISPGDIDYINAHGTSTPTNDPLETKAFKKVLGDHAYSIPISSTKSMMGHLVGGAGGVEAIICLLAMQEGFVPPTINLENPDEECDLDYIANTGRTADVTIAMSDNLGFGGHNGTVVFRKFKN